MLADDFFDDIEDDGIVTIDQAIGGAMGRDEFALDEQGRDEGTEQLDRHLTRETALVHLQIRSNGNDGTTGVVDAFAKEVLTEAALFAL